VTDEEALAARLRAAGCVFAEDEARLLLEAAQGEALAALVGRRVAGEPLEHVLGRVEFGGVRVEVDPGVFIPRQRTTHLVDLAAAATPRGGVVLDLCCGSGALGLVVAGRVASVALHAVDIDPVAVACARRNLAGVGTAYAGDLTAPLPAQLRGTVDVIVANVPYVPTGAIDEMPIDSRDHEPPVTVDGGADGLDVLRRVAAAAAEWLRPGGRLFVEVSRTQVEASRSAYEEVGLAADAVRDHERDATVLVGRRPPRT
jgi:release factor glutamine methyltransferase